MPTRSSALRLPLASLVALAALLLVPAIAAAGSWKSLGSTTVDFSQPRHEIVLTGTDGVHNRMFETRKAGVIFEGAWLHFADGAVVDVEIRQFVNLGGRSRVFSMPEGKGAPEKIVFRCSARDGSGRSAEVVLLGAK